MANTMRWRYGDTNPVMIAAASDAEIEIGDLLLVESNAVVPASGQADQGTSVVNQTEFKANFAGVAMQASPTGSGDPIRVATTGVFEFECASATFEVGDLIGATENATGDRLLDQTVEAVPSISAALGRCGKRVNPASTRVLVDLVSTITRGGAYEA